MCVFFAQAQIAEPSCSAATSQEAIVMSQRAAAEIALPSECTPFVHEGCQCACGAYWTLASQCIATRQGVQSYIYHMAKVQPVSVYQLKCSCGEVLQYDGIQDAILNLNNVDLFTHEVMKW